MDNIEETKIEEVKIEEQPVIEDVVVDNPKLEKSYLLFAELHGSLDPEYSEEDRVKKLKELKSELDSVIGFKDTEVDDVKSILDVKLKEFDEVNAKYEDLNKKYSALSEQNKALSVLAKEFKAAKTGPLVTETVAMNQKTPQEIYDDLLKTDPARASSYANSVRFSRS